MLAYPANLTRLITLKLIVNFKKSPPDIKCAKTRLLIEERELRWRWSVEHTRLIASVYTLPFRKLRPTFPFNAHLAAAHTIRLIC